MSQAQKDSIAQFYAHTPHIYSYLVALFIAANLIVFIVARFLLNRYPHAAHKFLRIILGIVLIQYGFLKFFKLQGFSLPVSGDINSVSGAQLFWYFFGYSYVYLIFAGSLECAAGFFLLFKGTWRLGALLAVTLLLNITVMDYVYNVGPVKYLATNLTALFCLLIVVDRQRFIQALRELTTTDRNSPI